MVAIRDKSGRVLAEGAHPSVRDLLVEAVARNRRLPGADLAGLDLSGLDLRRACLPDARLDGANLRQTRFDGASLSRASLANVSAQGAGFAGAVLEGAIADGGNFGGAGLRQAWMIGFAARGARFDDADASGADMTGAVLVDGHFQRARLVDVRFADATLYGNDLQEADLTSAVEGLPLAMRPDRSLGARVVGNKFSPKAKLCPGLAAFRRDTWIGWAVNAVSTGAAGGLGALAAMVLVPNIVDAKVGPDLVRSGAAVVALVGAPLLVRTIVGGRIRDALQPHADRIVQGAAQAMDRAMRAGSAARDLVALLWHGGSNAVHRAVLATRAKADARGWTAGFARLALGSIKIVFCDRRHLALAMQELSRPRIPGSRGEAETVLVRQGACGDGPLALRLHADGSVTAVHPEGTATWGIRGAPTTTGTLPEGAAADDGGFSAKGAFQAAVFADHGVAPIATHWFSNHFEAGPDGALLVVDHIARNVGNWVGPAVLTLDGERKAVVDGRLWEGAVGAPSALGSDRDMGAGVEDAHDLPAPSA
ncbi:hypothetical protein BHAOGJBA_4425 [Methylobacterium hispanicum]|uniref:Pentapeptide repeat protein n=1 Tax=Methylobacterium hispanicum TaxID=270350 RepID=A0AAV4ZSS1_9HYPH|nr:pentapeptide repeat-containing protein [Methylobacterium hispanicum]GJD90881.1 hypothetical protein BHAOGJBA_4425 [Methylobacterium hispanicum]